MGVQSVKIHAIKQNLISGNTEKQPHLLFLIFRLICRQTAFAAAANVHRRNKVGTGEDWSPTFRLEGTNNVLVLAVSLVFKKQEISLQ